jgi:hypothetical protein
MIEKYSLFILNVVLQKYQKVDRLLLDKLNFEKLLVKASDNRILKVFADNLLLSNIQLTKYERGILSNISSDGSKLLKALGDTLKLLDEVFSTNNVDYLIVKTYKYFDYVTFDVDVLVRYEDFDLAKKALSENDVEITPHPGKNTQGLHQRNCFKQGLLKIDLHRKFFWLGIDHIDDDFLWRNTRKEIIGGVSCPIPSIEVDFLLHNKQLIFERRYITLLDFLAIKLFVEDKDNAFAWEVIEAMVCKYKWQTGFNKLMAHLNQINKVISGNEILFMTKTEVILNNNIEFPYIYPFIDDLTVFIEIFARHRKVPFINLAHYVYSWSRYRVNSRLPFYDHWYKFNIAFSNKYSFQNVIN